jgi:hypothetical protein
MMQTSLKRPRRCCKGGRVVFGEDRKWSIASAIEDVFRWGRDQERVGEWKWIPKTIPEVVGPKDLSKWGHGAASFTLSSWHRERYCR